MTKEDFHGIGSKNMHVGCISLADLPSTIKIVSLSHGLIGIELPYFWVNFPTLKCAKAYEDIYWSTNSQAFYR